MLLLPLIYRMLFNKPDPNKTLLLFWLGGSKALLRGYSFK
jgi:hypothetical protein